MILALISKLVIIDRKGVNVLYGLLLPIFIENGSRRCSEATVQGIENRERFRSNG